MFVIFVKTRFCIFGYIILVVMLVPFFVLDYDHMQAGCCNAAAWIFSQCHKTRGSEQAYVATALVISCLGSVLWRRMAPRKARPKRSQSRREGRKARLSPLFE